MNPVANKIVVTALSDLLNTEVNVPMNLIMTVKNGFRGIVLLHGIILRIMKKEVSAAGRIRRNLRGTTFLVR